MRTGEILALKWSDLDYENSLIKIRRAKRQGIEDKPKTKASIRDIDIIDILYPYLLNHLKFKTHKSEYIFTSNFEKSYSDCGGIFARYWKPIFEKVNIEYRNPYQMRHTFASMMISNGEDILWGK